jgi:predicted Zn-dependent peptidase
MAAKHAKTTLENGLRVLSHSIPHVRSVSVGVLVNVGPKDEGPDQAGYSHLIEHMIFQGTPERDAHAIAKMMETAGGAIGAFTARDYTVYHATVLDDYLPFGLEVLGDMLTNSIIPEEALKRQLAVIENEISGRENPIQIVNDLAKRALWPGSSLSIPIAGLPESIGSVTRGALRAFIQQYYIAENMIVAAAGNVTHTSFAHQVYDAFHDVRSDEEHIPHSWQQPEKVQRGHVLAERRDLNQVYFALALPAPPYNSPDRYAWHVLASLLGGSPTSRLYRTLREEKGLVYHVSASYHAYGGAGALVIEGATRPETLVVTLAGILLELMALAMPEADLDAHFRAVQSLVSQHLIAGDSAYVRMSRLAMQELYFNRVLSTNEISKGLKAQGPPDIQAIAEECFNSGLPGIGLVGPISETLLNQVSNMLADFGEAPQVAFATNGASALKPTSVP